MKIYHQVGHNSNWNIESHGDDGAGDGLILSPRYMSRERIEALGIPLKNQSYFDPQWFLPDTPRGKLEEYPFFPDVYCGGFDTKNYVGADANQCASDCLDFQRNNRFEGVIIPTRHYSGMLTTFMDMQTQQFINPFIQAIQQAKESGQLLQEEVLLQLILNEGMISDVSYCDDILDWITGMDEITGVYLILEVDSTSKQIKNNDIIYHYLNFINMLKENELTVVVGYVNTESIVLSVANPDGITMGAYENMRKFSTRPFGEDPGIQKSPNPRLYCSQLLQWVDSTYLGALKRQGFSDILDSTSYLSTMQAPGYKWWFSKPEIYKHYFQVFYNQVSPLSAKNGEGRFNHVTSMIEQALAIYSRITHSGVVLDPDSDGSHLPHWQTALNEFGNDVGWR
jgi:hypothetical protein